MKKCTFCGKEVAEDFEGACPECGGEIIAEENKEIVPVKSAGRKKLGVIVAAVAIVICAVAAGTFFVLNSNNDAPVSQEESADKKEDKKEDVKAEKADKSASENDDTENASDKVVSPDETGTESSSSESDAATILPEDFKMEDMEKLIDEFNTTTDEKRKEELRLILEAIFSQAEELTVE